MRREGLPSRHRQGEAGRLPWQNRAGKKALPLSHHFITFIQLYVNFHHLYENKKTHLNEKNYKIPQ
jgi:hypothetical protein